MTQKGLSLTTEPRTLPGVSGQTALLNEAIP